MLTTTFLVLTLLGMLMGAFAAYLSHELLIDKIQKVVSQSCLELKDEPKELQTKAEDVLKKTFRRGCKSI